MNQILKLLLALSLVLTPLSSLAQHKMVFEQNSLLPRTTNLYSQFLGTQKSCTLNIFLHGWRQDFEKDPIAKLNLENVGRKLKNSILVVPNLASRCKKNCRGRHYDRFSFTDYVESLSEFLTKNGQCLEGIKQIHFFGHSGSYYPIARQLLGDLISLNCETPTGPLASTRSVILFDALFYGSQNRNMKNMYKALAQKAKSCANRIRFVHHFRNVNGHAPKRNSCQIKCRYQSRPNLNEPVQMIRASSAYNSYDPGHWSIAADGLVTWLKLLGQLED